ncbi:MAG: DUF3298 domain-containing protein [Bacillota bacterium]
MFPVDLGFPEGTGGETTPAAGTAVTVMVEGQDTGVRGAVSDTQVAVPLKALFGLLGCRVTWQPAERTAVLERGSRSLAVSPGQDRGLAGDHEVWVSPAPRLAGGRLVVLLMPVAENLGCSLKWDPRNTTLDLTPLPEPAARVITRRIREESERLKVDIQYPEVSGLGPAVDAAINQPLKDWALDALAGGYKAVENAAQAPEAPKQSEVVADYRVTLNQDSLLSIVLTNYTYTAGAAHGVTIQTSDTFDLETGRIYALQDLFRPGVDYIDLLTREVRRQMRERGLEESLLTPFETVKPTQKWYLTNDGLVLYYGQYEYWPYAWGIQEFPIPLADLKDVLVPPFSELAE